MKSTLKILIKRIYISKFWFWKNIENFWLKEFIYRVRKISSSKKKLKFMHQLELLQFISKYTKYLIIPV